MQELIREPINTNLLQRYIDEWLSHVNTTHNWKRLHQILSNLLMGVVSATDTHIGSTDLTLTSNRTLAGAGYNFTINNVANLLLSATTDINLTSANQLHITLPSTATAPVGAPLLNTLYGMGVMELAGYGFPTSLTVVDDNKMLVYNHISKAFVTQTQPSAVGGFTPGSVLFADTDGSITEDNSQLFWDKTNNYFGIGTAVPSYRLDVTGNTRLGQTNAALGLESAVVVTHLWNDAGVTPTTLLMSATDTLSPSNSLIIQALVNLTSIFKVRKDGRITTAETVEFTNTLTQQTTPTGFLTLSGSNNGTIQYSTVGNLQTALGIDAAALTAGYIAYGTGSGITGESGFFYNTTDNRMGLGTDTPMTKLNVVDTINTSPRGILSSQYSTDTAGARIGFAKARGSVSSPSVISSGDTIGRLMFRGFDNLYLAAVPASMGFVESASIEVISTGTIASATGRVPTRMVFSTGTDAATTVLTEAMRINSDQTVLLSAASVVSISALKSQGAWFTGGTTTTNKPHFLLEPTGVTVSNNWNIAGTGLGINSESLFTGDLINCQVNSNKKFIVSATGTSYLGGAIQIAGSVNISTGNLTAGTANLSGITTNNGADTHFVSTGVFTVTTPRYSYLATKTFQPAAVAGTYSGFEFQSIINQTGTASGAVRAFFSNPTLTSTVNYRGFEAGSTFAPTSGTGTFWGFVFEATINQTGGASGITRGVYINPTLTAAADFRAIDVVAGRSTFAARVQFGKGANVASAATVTLGNDGNLFHITGTTNIDNITTTNWQAGSEIVLIFDDVLTVNDGTGNLQLAGNFTTSANDTMKLIYNGTSWFELSRSVN